MTTARPCQCHAHVSDRREFLSVGAVIAAAALLVPRTARADAPRQIAGIALPDSALARRVTEFGRQSYPAFLFNHCMRTYFFGALAMNQMGRRFDAEEAFAGAILHDLGLMPAFESPHASFEGDGADAAEKFLLAHGEGYAKAETVWHSIVDHDGRWAIATHDGPESMLVAAGASADVVGPDINFEPSTIDAILRSFPRLQFKKRFTETVIAHCRRKPGSQRGTWLGGLDRELNPGAYTGTIERQIADAPFPE